MDAFKQRSSLDVLSSEVATMMKLFDKLSDPSYLQAMRRNEGLTLTKMARLMGSYPGKINKIELSKVHPDIDYIFAFYTALIRYEGQKEAWRHDHL
ncbi:helix-turn-helix transcriptional regulator [Lacticaseibacillus pabuli]|uniref:Helix-turn-helix transcriptional regulator n=1 Tax=Lacticaseibacillus pabuli TaxID=3025672 RepID=A0ABY7WWV6_9LACO|nr:helix-turn-helix transcriptional regulator [Lacticaseibacillus sp. KACC 23028]WDF83615.1 helix-turn-helix transcriptional regulator [Lacticaseibacillus sp. KACC 23028]